MDEGIWLEKMKFRRRIDIRKITFDSGILTEDAIHYEQRPERHLTLILVVFVNIA